MPKSSTHLRRVVERLAASSFTDYSLAECEADLRALIEERDALREEVDLYGTVISEFVATVGRSRAEGSQAPNASPWSFADRFVEALGRGTAMRLRAPQDGPGALDPAKLASRPPGRS